MVDFAFQIRGDGKAGQFVRYSAAGDVEYFSPADVQLKVKRLHPDAVLPKYATDGAACFDLQALMHGPDAYALVNRGTPTTFRTGLAFEVPAGHVLMIYSRSGHGFKHGVRLINCTGVIDSDYRGEIFVKLIRDDAEGPDMRVLNGDRIAQAMLVPIPRIELVEVDELSETVRGVGGLGSTGA